ncbi:MAG: hypothetical protein P8Z49_07115, partial [Acidobacteriota bacterium]
MVLLAALMSGGAFWKHMPFWVRVGTGLVILLVFSTGFSLPAWKELRRRRAFFPWDWGLSIYPLAFWLLLYYWGFGPHEPANFMELAPVGMMVMPVSYLRAYVLNRYLTNPVVSSLVSILLLLG